MSEFLEFIKQEDNFFTVYFGAVIVAIFICRLYEILTGKD
ncbi:hypothetical protein SAMN05421679_10683 [Epilithonimonas pallida]|uniref:Uncharacterized protein n=1 Tax=Epilithonimonas pallida TaxID=373671 RepID=A0ABY1R555_9FLAO|nr:hypothetical protein SAMN05421679_10683 [Epilithonimonas pallida]